MDTKAVEHHRQQLQARASDWSAEFMRSTGNVRAEQWSTDYAASIAQQMPNHQLLQSQWQAAITDIVPE
jgi:ubiquinone biosynthesis protein UbiJ